MIGVTQLSLDAIRAPVLSCSSNVGLPSTFGSPYWVSSGPMARTMTLLGWVPWIMSSRSTLPCDRIGQTARWWYWWLSNYPWWHCISRRCYKRFCWEKSSRPRRSFHCVFPYRALGTLVMLVDVQVSSLHPPAPVSCADSLSLSFPVAPETSPHRATAWDWRSPRHCAAKYGDASKRLQLLVLWDTQMPAWINRE